MLNLEEFDKLIMKTREQKLDFHMTESDFDHLIGHCDVKYSIEQPVPADKTCDHEFAYFGVLIQIHIVKWALARTTHDV